MATRASMGLYQSENKSNNSHVLKDEKDLGSLTIPNALVSYCNKVLYSSYIALERQLGQTRDPETYEKLDILTQRMFESWVSLGYREGGEKNSGL